MSQRVKLKLDMQVRIQISFAISVFNEETGVERINIPWFGNTQLTSGRNEMADRSWFTDCQVGTDNTPAAAGQTGLLGFIAGTDDIEETITAAEGSAPFFGYKRKRFRYGSSSGIANENLNEVGIGWDKIDGPYLTNRALIVDITGTPVTVTPLTGEIMDVWVEVRYYPPLSDSTGTVTLDGVIYNYICRAAAVTSKAAWADDIGLAIASKSSDPSHWSAYDGDIGTIEQYPDGLATDSATSNDYTNAYQNNSYEIDFGMSSGPTGWNVLTGLLMRSLQFLTTAGHYQIQFDSQSNPGYGIPKTDQKILTLEFTLGWAEEIIP